MMEAGFDPNHPGYADAQEWIEWAYGDGPSPDPAALDVKAMDDHLKSLSELLTRKYLLHSGEPRQIATELGMPQ